MGYVFTQYSNKSGVDVSVVQSTGTSTVDVMSQDATTRELNYVKRAINKSASALLELQNGIITPVGSFQTDSSVAYVKDVPENALPRAELKKVGGITKKTATSTNHLPYPYPPNATTITGVTFTDRGDGSIEVSGTADDYVIYVLASEGSVNFGNSNMSAGISFGAGDGYVLSGGTDHVTIQYFAETRECLLTIAQGVTVDDEVVYPMVNTGMFPEPWEPYKAPKLYTAKVTEVESVGANLIPYPYREATNIVNGITFTDNGDGTITANGTATADANYWLVYEAQMPAGSYILSGTPSVEDYGVMIVAHYQYTDGSPFYLNVYGGDEGRVLPIPTNTMIYLYIRVKSGITVANYVFKPMLNKGSTPLPYTPYLHHTLPIPVEVRGAMNVLPEESAVIGKYWEIDANGTVYQEDNAELMSASEPLMVEPNITYCVNSHGGVAGAWAVWFVDENYKSLGRTEGWQAQGGTFTVPSNCWYALFSAWYASESYQNDIMINEGTTALPYEPYSAVKGLDGYGLGVSDTVYNYIDWENKQFVKMCASVDLGTLEWTAVGGGVFKANASAIGYEYGMNGICPKYATVSTKNTDKTLYMFDSYYGENVMAIFDTAYTDAATFQTAMSGVMLVYELATPEVTDISQYITDDDVNVMKVGAGGTITFKNGYAEAVPSEIEYQVGA